MIKLVGLLFLLSAVLGQEGTLYKRVNVLRDDWQKMKGRYITIDGGVKVKN